MLARMPSARQLELIAHHSRLGATWPQMTQLLGAGMLPAQYMIMVQQPVIIQHCYAYIVSMKVCCTALRRTILQMPSE
jgi:hypothetical protein